MEIRPGSLFFPELRHEGPQTADAIVRFPRAVNQAVAGLVGYSATFQGDDHHLGRLQIQLETFVDSVDPQNVIVRGTFGLRDWSGTFDDTYTGTAQFAVIGDLVAAEPPAPGEARPDLIVVDVEVNQVVQHFRDQFHLDSANVFPDNSIRLVADKPTGVRVYVDYDRSSGLSLISALTGGLDVVASDGTTTTLMPLNNIVPRRDVQIDRKIANHTLNFAIPENLCRGLVTLCCRVRNNFDATQFSEEFQKQLLFEDLPDLRVFAIGIEYTGPDKVDGGVTSAPTEADFTATLPLTEQLYPIPAVTITGYDTMTYKEKLKSNINNGCDKMGDLKNAIGDLRGDSTDIYYGLLNTGVITGSVGGCGGSSAGAGVGMINAQGTMAHEIGHVLGRQHAPCDNVTRCDRPKNTDDDYPLYIGYDSDSIGEYGFDTTNGAVKDPAVAHDFMGYSGPAWISPYTYKALMSRTPAGASAAASIAVPTDGGGVFRPRRPERAEWLPRKEQRLFLNLVIHRDRRVDFRPAFHFPALPTPVDPVETSFVVEFLDDKDEVLTADCLYDLGDSCGCGCGDPKIWPKRIYQGVAFDTDARKLAIFEDDQLIHEQKIPAPPKLLLSCSGGEDDPHVDQLSFSWTVGGEFTSSGGQGEGEPGGKPQLWYLLQWRDRNGVWRGVMPRTQDTKAVVKKRLFGRQSRIAVRVLATSGIATGTALWEGMLRTPPVPPRERGPRVVLPGIDPAATGVQPLPPSLRVAVVDRFGLHVARPEVVWYSGRGAEIARGRSLDLRQLRRGLNTVRAVVLDTGAGGAVASWLIERDRNDRFRLIRGNVPRRDQAG